MKSHVDGARLMDFGHSVYKTRDSRSEVMSQIGHQVNELGTQWLGTGAGACALAGEHFIKRKQYPGLLLKHRADGYRRPRSMLIAIFALTRTSGWVAQWKEIMVQPVKKIGRS